MNWRHWLFLAAAASVSFGIGADKGLLALLGVCVMAALVMEAWQ